MERSYDRLVMDHPDTQMVPFQEWLASQTFGKGFRAGALTLLA
jgi:hypothetical protein